MDLILNEKKYAEYVLLHGVIDKKPSATIQLITRYFYHVLGLRKKGILFEINKFMSINYPLWNQDMWYDSICRYISNAKKYPLLQIDSIEISDEELSSIKSIEDEQIEKLMFSCLCLAKYYNISNSQNSNWCNTQLLKIFKIANISGNKKQNLLRLHKLKNKGFISLSLKCSNTNIQVNIIDGHGKYSITNLTDLGNQYLALVGLGVFCEKCGQFCRQNKARTRKYCDGCSSPLLQDTRYVTCIDCGKKFAVSIKNTKTNRCKECYSSYRRKYKAEKEAVRRTKFVDRADRDKNS